MRKHYKSGALIVHGRDDLSRLRPARGGNKLDIFMRAVSAYEENQLPYRPASRERPSD